MMMMVVVVVVIMIAMAMVRDFEQRERKSWVIAR